jgi:DNA polymerase-4
MRKIIHIDMDAFFASIEQRDFPELRGKPVAVGGAGKRGVVAAASYEAREFGVFSAMPSSIALRKCPDLIFVKHRFDEYKEVSRQIRDIFFEYTDLVEPLSLDEAYLDVTENKKQMKSATMIAQAIKGKIKSVTKLTASAGVSINKFLAKVASDQDKPDGLFVITPDQAEAFVEKLPVEKFFGIGKVTTAKLHEMGIKLGSDLKAIPKEDLLRRFGKVGNYYYDIARAIDDRPVNPKRIRKSLGAERTFEDDLLSNEEILRETARIAEITAERMIRAKAKGKTVTIKIKYTNFEVANRSKTVGHFIFDGDEIKTISRELMARELPVTKGIRLIGVTLSNLELGTDRSPKQLTLDF